MTGIKIPPIHCAAYLAAAHIHAEGPQNRGVLFSTVNFGINVTARRDHLNRILETGWLVEFVDKIDLSESARRYFDGLVKDESAPCNPAVAAVRTSSAMTSPPLRKAFIPSSKGFRDDIPEYSQRPAEFLHRTVVSEC